MRNFQNAEFLRLGGTGQLNNFLWAVELELGSRKYWRPEFSVSGVFLFLLCKQSWIFPKSNVTWHHPAPRQQLQKLACSTLRWPRHRPKSPCAPSGHWLFSLLSSENQAGWAHSRSTIQAWVRKEERGAGRRWERAKTPEQAAKAAHLQLLSFHLHRRAHRLHFHGVLLHQVLQALPQLLSELLLLLFSLMSDFTQVFFVFLLHAFYFTACFFLGL